MHQSFALKIKPVQPQPNCHENLPNPNIPTPKMVHQSHKLQINFTGRIIPLQQFQIISIIDIINVAQRSVSVFNYKQRIQVTVHSNIMRALEEAEQGSDGKVLTHEQKAIIDEFLRRPGKGFLYMTFAPPGTGKTFLSKRLIHQLIGQKKVSPKDILFLTFNKNLNEEIKAYFKDNRPANFYGEPPTALTFGSLALKILNCGRKNYFYGVLEEPQAKKILKGIVEKNIGTELNVRMDQIIDKWYVENKSEKEVVDKLVNRIFARVTRLHATNKNFDTYYQQQSNRRPLNERQIFDFKILDLYLKAIDEENEKGYHQTFDKMTYDAIKKVSRVSEPYIGLPVQCMAEYIFVDQFQDLNKAQLDLLEALIDRKKERRIFIMGDPDQSIYGWRYANYKNVALFEENLKTRFKYQIEKKSLKISNRLYDKMAELAYSFITSDDPRINYRTERQNFIRGVTDYGKLETLRKGENEEIVLQEYKDQFDEARKIAERIWACSQRGVEFKMMTILLRSTKGIFSTFIKKIQFMAQEFSKEKKEKQGIDVKIPLLVLGSKNIFNSDETNFLIRCLEYFYYMHKKNGSIDNEKKKKVLNKILKSISTIGPSDNFLNRMTDENVLSLDAILVEQKFLECQIFYSTHSRRDQREKHLKYREFRERFNGYLELCEDGVSSFGQIVKYLIENFYDTDFMDLKETENVRDFAEYVENFLDSGQGKKDWKTLITNLYANGETDHKKLPNKVMIQTLHKSKGQTFHTVFLPKMNGNFEWMGDDEEEGFEDQDIRTQVARRNEELRLYYTGITRTKGSLYVTRWINDKDQKGKTQEVKRQFLFMKRLIETQNQVQKSPQADTYQQKWLQYLEKLKQSKKKGKAKGRNREKIQHNSEVKQEHKNGSKRVKLQHSPSIKLEKIEQKQRKGSRMQSSAMDEQKNDKQDHDDINSGSPKKGRQKKQEVSESKVKAEDSGLKVQKEKKSWLQNWMLKKKKQNEAAHKKKDESKK